MITVTLNSGITDNSSKYKGSENQKRNLALMAMYHSGDSKLREQAINSFVESVIPLIHHILKQYSGLIDDNNRDDFYSEAVIGTIEALKTYDAENYAFTTYCPYKIKEKLTGLISDMTNISKHYGNIISRISKVERECEQRNIELSNKEIADLIGYSEAQVIKAYEIKNMSTVTYLDEVGEEGLNSFKTNESPEEIAVKKERTMSLFKALEQLSDIERDCITHKFGVFGVEKLSISVIAKKYSITADEVNSYVSKAIVKLQNNKKLNAADIKQDFKRCILNDKPIVQVSKESIDSLLEVVDNIFDEEELLTLDLR